jgi:hypothetical protein
VFEAEGAMDLSRLGVALVAVGTLTGLTLRAGDEVRNAATYNMCLETERVLGRAVIAYEAEYDTVDTLKGLERVGRTRWLGQEAAATLGVDVSPGTRCRAVADGVDCGCG